MTFYIFLLACAAAASTGIFFKPGQWYESLAKPSFTRPNWVFPVAWAGYADPNTWRPGGAGFMACADRA